MKRLNLPQTRHSLYPELKLSTSKFLDGRIEYAPEMDAYYQDLVGQYNGDWFEAINAMIFDIQSSNNSDEARLINRHITNRGHVPGFASDGGVDFFDTSEFENSLLDTPIIFGAFDKFVAIKSPFCDRAFVYFRRLPIVGFCEAEVDTPDRVYYFENGDWLIYEEATKEYLPSEPPPQNLGLGTYMVRDVARHFDTNVVSI
jgi:hypothetical protein